MKDWTGNRRSIYVTLGASNHANHEREAHDFYATRPADTLRFLDTYNVPHYIWEPSCGAGHMAQVLADSGRMVTATDLIDYGYGKGGIDFFAQRKALGQSNERSYAIMTNPPYRYATVGTSSTPWLCSMTASSFCFCSRRSSSRGRTATSASSAARHRSTSISMWHAPNAPLTAISTPMSAVHRRSHGLCGSKA